MIMELTKGMRIILSDLVNKEIGQAQMGNRENCSFKSVEKLTDLFELQFVLKKLKKDERKNSV